jgi:hypothetical protein
MTRLNLAVVILVVGALIVLGPASTHAQDEQIDFDIFLREGQVFVWTDLSLIITGAPLSELKEGRLHSGD